LPERAAISERIEPVAPKEIRTACRNEERSQAPLAEKGTTGVTPLTQSHGSRPSSGQPGYLFEKATGPLLEGTMRISDAEVQKILRSHDAVVRQIIDLQEGIDDPQYEIDPKLVKEVVQAVMAMPDREELISELKARIDRGEYHPTGDEIAEAMIRRSIADRVR
jgi:hypothetical protein